MSYFDNDLMVHDTPCKDGKPSSNNRLIYTAYLYTLGASPKTFFYNEKTRSMVSFKEFRHNRLPEKTIPPISKDEILGGSILPYFTHEDLMRLKKNKFNFSNLIGSKKKKINPFLLIYEALTYRGGRNAVWETPYYPNLYILNFRLPRSMRYVIGFNSPLNALAFVFGAIITLLFKRPTNTSNSSSINIWWLMLTITKSKTLLKWGGNLWEDSFRFYFPEDHPIIEAINKRGNLCELL